MKEFKCFTKSHCFVTRFATDFSQAIRLAPANTLAVTDGSIWWVKSPFWKEVLTPDHFIYE